MEINLKSVGIKSRKYWHMYIQNLGKYGLCMQVMSLYAFTIIFHKCGHIAKQTPHLKSRFL